MIPKVVKSLVPVLVELLMLIEQVIPKVPKVGVESLPVSVKVGVESLPISVE